MFKKDLNAIQIVNKIIDMDSSETLELTFHNRPGYKYIVRKIKI